MSCEKNDPSVVDPTPSIPRILSAIVTPNTFDTLNIGCVLVAQIASDVPIESVNAKITNPLGVVLTNVVLKDDGVLPDTSAGDGRFTGKLSYTLSCKLVGSYRVEFLARNISGINSNIFIVNFHVTNINNHRPILDTVISPDSLRRPSGTGSDSVNIAFLQAWPHDPDGTCDIQEVYFHSFKPDGTPGANGLPVPMYDDGNQQHCDSTAGDGKYSLCIRIVNNPLDPLYSGPPQLGNYKFKYNARDIGGLVSDTLVKFIYVHP